MYNIEVPKIINFIMESFYRFGFWNRGDVATVRETTIKFFYSVYYFLFVISVILGAYQCEDTVETISLTQLGVVASVLFVQLLYIIWRKKDIVNLVNRIGLYSVRSREQQTLINGKLQSFDKIITSGFYFLCLMIFCLSFVVPFLGSEKKLFYNIAFPLDWKSSEFAFWTAFAFFVGGIFVTTVSLLFSILMWYFMFVCGLMFNALGTHISAMGVTTTTIKQLKLSKIEKLELFRRDLIESIKSHIFTEEYFHIIQERLENRLFEDFAFSFLAQVNKSNEFISFRHFHPQNDY